MVRDKRVLTPTQPINKRRDLRILWSSNSPTSYSGYGVFTKDLLSRLVKDGWPVAAVAFYGLQGHPVEIDGLKIYPQMAEPFGSDALVAHGLDWRANVIFTMQDVHTLNPSYLQQLKYWIPYFPCDKTPAPQLILNPLRYAYKLLTFSQFGQDTVQQAGFASTMIPEGTDVNIFKPLPNKQELRKKYSIPPNAIHFTMVAANKENPPRKGFQEALEGFKLFSDKHPEAFLSIYIQQIAPEGFPITGYAHHLGLDGKILVRSDYHTVFKWVSEDINEIYNTADILLHPSQTEGFGLCLIEAQAAGIPVIIQRCQSMPELIIEGRTGVVAETMHKRFTNDLSFVNVADPKSIYEAMERQYKKLKDNPEQVSKDCRANVVDNYNIDTIVETQWIKYLEELQDKLLPLTPKPQENTIK